MHIVSIHTEGHPFDGGREMALVAQRFRECVTPHFQSVQTVTPRLLESYYPAKNLLWADFRAQLDSVADQFPSYRFNPTWAAVGFLAWKVLAIQHALRSPQVRPGELLLYQDMDYIRYPSLTRNLRMKVPWLEETIGAKDALFFSDYIRPLGHDIRPDLLSNVRLSMRQRLIPMPIWAGAMVLRKSETVCDFLAVWEETCSWENLQPFSDAPKPQLFRWHSGEQSVLNLLSLEKRTIFQHPGRFAIRFLWQSRDFIPRVQIVLTLKVILHSWLQQLRSG